MSPSKLNPNAAAYVPLAKRGDEKSSSASVYSDSSNQTASSGSPKTTEHHLNENGNFSGFYGSSLQNDDDPVVEGQFEAEKVEMELQYLHRVFPGMSEQSVNDVYFVSGCDWDCAFDMLSHFEYIFPDSLDIGDVSEPQISSKFTNLKVKEAADEASGASAESPVATSTS